MDFPNNIWNCEAECLPREELNKLQLNRLQQTLSLVAGHVPCYQAKFKESGFQPSDLKSLDDLSQLPFTTKDDLRVNYPYGMFAVPMRDVVRIHSSSGIWFDSRRSHGTAGDGPQITRVAGWAVWCRAVE